MASSSSSLINKIFVYGTLKPGERNYDRVAIRAGQHTAKESSIKGFDLFHLHPENYPAILKRGDREVFGWTLTYTDIDRALELLDGLEGVSLVPPLYNRITTTVYPDEETVWVYEYSFSPHYLESTTTSLVESGIWKPQSAQDNLYP